MTPFRVLLYNCKQHVDIVTGQGAFTTVYTVVYFDH